jgi:hypothetical protein
MMTVPSREKLRERTNKDSKFIKISLLNKKLFGLIHFFISKVTNLNTKYIQ